MCHESFSDIFHGDMLTTACGLPQPADGKIMEDCEDPGASVIIAAPMPVRDHAFKTILHEIVSNNRVVNETAGIASQCRDHRFDLRE